MKRTSKISGVSRIIKQKPSDSGSAITPEPSKKTGIEKIGQSGIDPSDLGLGEKKPEPKKEKKKGPGTIVLSDDEKLPREFIDKIENQLKEADDWNIGNTENTGNGPISNMPGAPDMPGADQEEGEDIRSWDKSPAELERAINDANREAIDEVQKAEREGKTDTEKTMGGSGRGGIRDRIEMEKFSQTDWASIFKTRLTEYSKEASKYLPYHRRFVSNKAMRTRIPSRTNTKDVLPELNLIIDTSSSLSYRELEVILVEVNKALSEAKIKNLNLILWTGTPYYYNSYKNINKNNFNKIIDDVQNNWEGGGNDVNKVYELMKKKGWAKKFTISLTDGYIRDHFEGSTKTLSNEVLDPNNTIFGIIYPTKSITVDQYRDITSRFPGEKVPIFLDSTDFY